MLKRTERPAKDWKGLDFLGEKALERGDKEYYGKEGKSMERGQRTVSRRGGGVEGLFWSFYLRFIAKMRESLIEMNKNIFFLFSKKMFFLIHFC